jgi:hypothetical protein
MASRRRWRRAFAKLREQAMLLAGCMHPPPLKAVPLIRVQGVERTLVNGHAR